MFSVNSTTIQQLADKEAAFHLIVTYLFLARGVSMRSMRRMSSYSAAHIVAKTRLSQSQVDSALQFLSAQNVIEVQESGNPQDKSGKWVLLDDVPDIFLPAVLTDNKHQVPPLMRLLHAASPEDTRLEYVLDELVVLLMLYRYQDMEKCGGIDPRAGLYRQWTMAAGATPFKNQVKNIVGSEAAIFEVGGPTTLQFAHFADAALAYVHEQGERHDRFFNALWHLQHLGFVYEVAQIWDSDPNGVDGNEAVPLYTHYVHDALARDVEPSLQKEIQRVSYRLGMLDGYKEFTELEYTHAESVRFRFVADKQVGGYPIGVYRLKFRHHSTAMSVDIDSESRRAGDWLRELQEFHLLQ
jgi:hypothetical protein